MGRMSAYSRWDHPRMRGEHSLRFRYNRRMRGSSPHARGARTCAKIHSGVLGIIPACAGSTRSSKHVQGGHWDHPRMRGEHSLYASTADFHRGSSPHARGALAGLTVSRVHQGIIPACAGSTSSAGRTPPRCRDHPRMRGEHRYSRTWRGPARGSSPRARGALVFVLLGEVFGGIIPACAGSTRPPALGRGPQWDHPRVRGEHAGP